MLSTQYVGIRKRFFALIADGVVILNVIFVFFLGQSVDEFSPKLIAYLVLTTILQWAYYALMESSPAQGTLGKMTLGIAVTDGNGKRISLRQATVRYLGKILWLLIFIVAIAVGISLQTTDGNESPVIIKPGHQVTWEITLQAPGGNESPYWVVVLFLLIVSFLLLIIGYLMAGFTPERQAFHDRIARTFVVDVSQRSRQIPQKALLQIAALALVSRLILQIVPSTPIFLSNSTTPEPEPTSFDTPTTFTLCENVDQLFPPKPNSYINGIWKIEFAPSGILHSSILRMKGDSGEMRTEFYDNTTQSQRAVLQTMKLWVSVRGLWLLGDDPRDAETNESVAGYSPDNIFFQQTSDGLFNAYNCDDSQTLAPASFEYVEENTETP